MTNFFESRNPYTGASLGQYPVLDSAALSGVLAAASAAFGRWRKVEMEHRAALLKAIGWQLLRERDTLARLITEEMGKPIRQSVAEIEKCAWVCEYYAENGAEWLQDEPVPIETGMRSRVVYQPLGAILLIMPWNFPFWQVFRCAAPLIMAGNAVVLKHAPNVGGCAEAIARIFRESGAMEGLFQSIFVEIEAIPKLIQSAEIQGVSLTGSVRAGRIVGALAGQAIKPVVLELGGSDACVILEDADLQKAAQVAVLSRMQTNGQTCIAAKRFIVMESVAEAFTMHLRDEFLRLKMGDPLSLDTQIGPLARLDIAEQLAEQVRQSVAGGARVLAGQGHQKGTLFFEPMLLTDIAEGMPAYHEELFGPVVSLLVATNETNALTLANATPFGLGASVWTQDEARGWRWAMGLEAGVVAVNQMVRSDPRLPFGGIKTSGVGRELGGIGMRTFTNTKTIFSS